MADLEFWRLCNELTVVQACSLILGLDPSVHQYDFEHSDPEDSPDGFEAIYAAVTNAIIANDLPATWRYKAYEYGWCEDIDQEKDTRIGIDESGRKISFKPVPCWGSTTVKFEDMSAWLLSRGYKCEFFFPGFAEVPDYLNPDHPQYPIKIAAAVAAWFAVVKNPELRRGKAPKTALQKWVTDNAKLFGLVKDDGSLNEQAIKDVAKIANWKTTGGAPESPG